MSKTLFKDGAILSMDPDVGDFRRGSVLIENGRIVEVDSSIDAEDCEVVDASDSIVMPGLVDAHRHLWYSGLRGANMDSVLFDIVADAWGKLGPAFVPDDVYAFTRAAIADALDSGVTTVFDWNHVINSPEHAEAGIKAHREMGMRAVFGYGASMDQKVTELAGEEAPSRSWDHAFEVQERYFGGDQRLTLALALEGLEYGTLETTREDIAAARKMGVPMSFHVGGPMGGEPKRSIQRLADEGLLGADMSFIHCCDSSPDEFRLLAEHGAYAVSCPGVDAGLNIGASPTSRMREQGLRPCFSTDAVIGTSGDLFQEARLGLTVDRHDYGLARFAAGEVVAEHGDRISAREALEAVTSAAAEACWLGDQVGSLTPGKRADLILLRASDTNLWPASNLLRTVVSSANRGNVDAVMVNGDFVKRDGVLLDVDLAAIRADLIRARDRLYAAGGYDDIEPKAL